jgi:hypothetical protein
LKAYYPNLHQEMLNCGVSVDNLAELLDVDSSEILDKMQGVSPWYLPEVVAICVHLKTSNVKKLFVRIDSNT